VLTVSVAKPGKTVETVFHQSLTPGTELKPGVTETTFSAKPSQAGSKELLMSRILDHIAELSPEKRTLLALRNPLSFAQQRLWFLDRFEPGSPFYNVSLGLRLKGRLDRRALHRALLEISRRHEVLRTIFVEIDGRPAQIVDLQIELELPLVDLTSLSDAGREAELKRLHREQGRQPLALALGNVLRAMLCRIKENDHAFLLTLHHIVADA